MERREFITVPTLHLRKRCLSGLYLTALDQQIEWQVVR
jgi:hypothetical protein